MSGVVAIKAREAFKKINCEWCGKNTIVTAKKYKDEPNFRFVEVFGVEHCICADCYERLE